MTPSLRAVQATIVMRQWTDRWRARTGVHPSADIVVPYIRKIWPGLSQAEFDYVFQHHERSRGLTPSRFIIDTGGWK